MGEIVGDRYAIERVIDIAAAELAIDPVELRRRNLIAPAAMPFKTGLVFTYDCGEFERTMELAMALGDRAGFAGRRAEAQGGDGGVQGRRAGRAGVRLRLAPDRGVGSAVGTTIAL